MKFLSYSLLALTLFASQSFSQAQDRAWLIGQQFEERPDPEPADTNAWKKINTGLHFSYASIDQRYPKSVIPALQKSLTHTVTGWKGEKVSAQILLWTKENIKSVSIEVNNEKSSNQLLAANTSARFLRYVLTDEFGTGCGKRTPTDYPAHLSADMLDDLKHIDIPAYSVRPVWITVDIPASIKADKYTLTLNIRTGNKVVGTLPLTVKVQNHTLPPAAQWSFHLDQWQHPSAVARVNNLKMWSDEHFEALKPQMELLAKAGQKVITATLNKDPWHVQTFDPYADMIIWTKKRDGSWEYDYTAFDKWVSLMMDLGVKKMINCYSIVPWNNEIHYHDETTNSIINVVAKPGTAIFEELWTPFLKDFSRHLKQKGWLEITNIALDERRKEELAAAFDLISRVAPKLGVAYADNHKTFKQYPNSKDVSTAIRNPIDSIDIVQRRSKGLNTTFYICCSDSFPNQFTFSSPAESAYLGWYTLATGYDGMLRWAFNSWVENPLEDSRFRTWPAGDTYIVYPQARTSVRYERLVEGIQSFEKVKILQQKLKNKGRNDLTRKIEAALVPLRKNFRDDHWLENLNKAKALVNEISDII
ncbi:DUF4091 domain-containing protein [Sphingobacterium sp. T2]|uniref:DUF4091 domain-containing protein n=1 Tax=Sphingobacterium sp. T2 TaxID=1590596 RepID=UPI00057BAF22|nr:DUF4091 domain-containing protein [Sphingobacterium sp. T2]